MRKLGFAKLGVTALSVLAATILVRGLAHADSTDPGTTVETKSTSQVQVSGDTNSTIQVDNSQQSSQTATPSTADQTKATTDTTQPATVSTGSQTTQDKAAPVVSNTQDPTQPSAVDQASGTVSNGFINVSTVGGGQAQVPVNVDHSTNQPIPVAPTPPASNSDKSVPVPAGSPGSVAPSTGTFGGGFGRDLSLRLAALRGLLPSQGNIALLAVLLLITSSFMTYLRRSGFQHAPRSDASGSSLLSFATPRVEIQAGRGAAPVFIVASDTKQLIGKEGRWM